MKKKVFILFLFCPFLFFGQITNTTVETALDITPVILGGTTYNSGTVDTTHDDHDIGAHGLPSCEPACCDLLYYKFKPTFPGTLRGDLTVFQPLTGSMLGYKTESADGNVTISDLAHHNVIGNFCGFRDSIQVPMTSLELDKYYYVGVFNHNQQTSQGIDSEITFNFIPDCPGGFVCTSQTITQCEPYTTPGGYTFTETGFHTEDIGVNRTYYSATINHTAETQDNLIDETVDTTVPIDYDAETSFVSYLEFVKSESRFVNLDAVQDDLAASNRSVFMWIKAPTNVTSTSQQLFAINSSGGGNICNLQLSTSEVLQVFDGATSRSSAATLNDGLWHHVGYTYNNATNETIVYADGVNVLTYTNGQDATATSVYSLGQEYDSGLSTGNYYDGLMTEVSVWNEVLDVADITPLMQNKIDNTHPKYVNLVGYYGYSDCDTDATILKDYRATNTGILSHAEITKTDAFEEIPNFDSLDWYTASWLKNDVEFETTTSASFVPDNGTNTYKLQLSRDLITITDEWNITNDATLDTSEFDLKEAITLSPNPVKNILNINENGLKNLKTVRIYSVSGKLLYESAFTKSINMEKYSNGLYFIQLTTTGNRKATFKVLKQ
jgi:hypothetical protein